MTHSDEVELPRPIAALERNAREIDQTFAQAGSELGQGLALFDALKQRLTELSAELSGERLMQAGKALAELAQTLRAIGVGLGRETEAIQELAGHGHAAGQVLERLLDHMRLITILARSARIEAVSVRAIGGDFGDFTGEIVALTTQASQTIGRSLLDHQQLAALLNAAVAAKRSFEGRYGAALAGLAGDLAATLAEVSQRQQRGAALTRDAAAHSGKIAQAAGGAIIALQSGDSIRQRLEHVIAAMGLARSIDAGDDGAGLEAEGRAAAVQLLHRLASAQLRASATALGDDAIEIERALAVLADDTSHLLDLVRSLYRGEGASEDSFLAALEDRLAQAGELLAGCDSARAGVDRVTLTLKTVLEACRGTVSALTAAVSTIELIGMNAGLRAARVGTEGRSLVVIAQELKYAADLVTRDARALAPLFAGMEQASRSLDNDETLGSSRFAALGVSMRESLSAMKETGERLSDALDRLMRDGEGFNAVVATARLSFSNAGAMSDQICAAGDALAQADPAQPVPAELAPQLAELLETRIWPHYTMASERQIHQAIASDNGLSAPAAAVTAPALDDVDDILF